MCLYAPPADAMLIAFDQNADYDSPNFAWFQDNYERFVYVDRIVVAERARWQGLATQFYEQLFEHARKAGHTIVACEVNSDPPNPASDAFHDRMGFAPAGSALLDNGKTVRYLTRQVI